MPSEPLVTILFHPSDIQLASDLHAFVREIDRRIKTALVDATSPWRSSEKDGPVVLLATRNLLRTLGSVRVSDMLQPLHDMDRLLVVAAGVRLRGPALRAHVTIDERALESSMRDDEIRQVAHLVAELSAAMRRRVDPGAPLSAALFQKVDALAVTKRTRSLLMADGIVYVGDLVGRTEAELLRIPALGRKALQEVNLALADLRLRLGSELPDWPPADLEEAKLRLEIAERVSHLRQTKGGARFKSAGDHLVMVAEGDANDLEAATTPLARQLQVAVLDKARRFADAASRLDNQPGWTGIGRAAAGLILLVDRPAEDLPIVLGQLYATTIELGSFAEQDERLADAPTYAAPLDPETRRPLDDLIRTLSPWMRAFPSVREMDDEARSFLVPSSELQPAAAVVRDARDVALLDQVGAEVLERLEDAALRGAFQGVKAGGRVHRSATNLVVLVAMHAAAFLASAVSSDFATTSPLTQRIGQFLVRAEIDIHRLVADAAPDLRQAIDALLEDFVSRTALRPERPRVPGRRSVRGQRKDEPIT